MKTKLIILCLGILLSACYKDRITADGNIKSEIRNLATFTEVHSSGSNKVHISYGTEYKIEVRGSGNLVSVFKTRVYNNKLSLGYERINVNHDDIEVFVTMPLLTELSLSGSGKADISGSFPDQENFNLRISGSADVV
ncbi:MAG: DUF2807 domain-containing protein, partial [Pyrinomonadaceae bacterium]|nr:DUF2807 domain-containing protein [Sphingobacteriaceae bacterium]